MFGFLESGSGADPTIFWTVAGALATAVAALAGFIAKQYKDLRS